MAHKGTGSLLILVLEDVEETRDGIEILLKADHYRVDAARDEEDAVARARRESPHLLLASLAGHESHVIATACRTRERAGLQQAVPIVIFSVDTIAEGAEVKMAGNIFLTRPDNFDQLRTLIHRLLREPPEPGKYAPGPCAEGGLLPP